MKLQKIKCPNCGGSLDMKINTNTKFIFCPYCGEQISVDDGKKEYVITKNININKNINHTKRTINDADVIRAKAEAREKKYKWIQAVGPVVGFALLFLLFEGFCMYMAGEEEREVQEALEAGKISAGSDDDYVDEKYEAAVEQLETLGFTNITTIDLDNSGIAFWNSGEVESISINGENNFYSTDYFEPDATIIIKYH